MVELVLNFPKNIDSAIAVSCCKNITKTECV